MEANLQVYFRLFIYVSDPVIKMGEWESHSLVSLRHMIVPVQRHGLDFQRHICRGFSVFSGLICGVIVRFVDIGGIVDHQRLNIPQW